jgi:cyclophilin family peptidyl-prolyl cis-trans isomerase
MTAHLSSRKFAASILFALCTVFVGCGRSDSNQGATETSGAPKVTVAPRPGEGSPSAATDPTFVPFEEAVRLDPPDGENRPPDTTAGRKSTVKLFETIAGSDGKPGLWSQVRLTSADGKRIKPYAVLKTDVGEIKIELFPDAAPNHVRSFICLARAGFFDGLSFHASIRREGGFGYLESGCPKGTGELGSGSIGYWLKPEVRQELTHEAGTVGAWHPENIERAACRFYITLNPNPGMDGAYTIFGKIVQGLEIAHTINQRPVQDDEHRGAAQEPHRIRHVVIIETLEDGTVLTARSH